MIGERGIAMGLVAALLSAWPAAADEAQKSPEPTVPTSTSPGTPIASTGPVYVPPPRERPRRRIGGGVRGPEAQWPRLYALVPRHTGLTASAAPSLYWWIDSLPPADTQLIFYLVNDTTDETLLRAPLARPSARGTNRVRLADHGVELAPGVEYEWSVALERGSAGEQLLVASGWIERIAAAEGGTAATGTDAVIRYAQQGLWYDSLATASELVEAHPDDAGPRQVRNALLEQVGLAEAAAP